MTITLGTVLQRLERERDTDTRFALFMPTTKGPCGRGKASLAGLVGPAGTAVPREYFARLNTYKISVDAPIILSLLSDGRGIQVRYWLDERILLDLRARVCYNNDNWGCDELVKRIPCRVVGSVPLEKGDDASPISRCESMHSADSRVGTAHGGFERPINSRGYTFRAKAVSSPFGESAAGLVLDCLA